MAQGDRRLGLSRHTRFIGCVGRPRGQRVSVRGLRAHVDSYCGRPAAAEQSAHRVVIAPFFPDVAT